MKKYKKSKCFIVFCFLISVVAVLYISSLIVKSYNSNLLNEKKQVDRENNNLSRDINMDKKFNNLSVSSKSCFVEENCFFNIRTDSSTSTSGYSSGDVIPFQTKFQLTPEVYGHWEEDSRKLSKGYVKCARCGKCFTDFMLAFHNEMDLSTPGGCWSNYYIGLDGQKPTTWAFVPDKSPCKIVLKYTFPQGVSYKDGSFEMTRWVAKNDVTDFCEIRSSGNELVVTISDIKSAPFYNAFKYEEYKKNLYYDPYDSDKGSNEGSRDPFLVKFDTKVESGVSAEGDVLFAMTCTNGSASHTDSYSISVRTASMQISNTDASGRGLSGAEFDIYQKKTRYPAGSNMGTSDWELFKSGVHAGDIITGMGTGTDAFDNQYKVVQTKAPDGYEEAYDTEFELFISENGTVTAENEEGDTLEVRNGTVQVRVVNEEAQQPSVKYKKIFASIKHSYDGNIDSRYSKEISAYVLSTESNGTIEVDKNEVYKVGKSGYKFDCITVNGVRTDTLPSFVHEGDAVVFHYIKDEKETKDLSATVIYYKEYPIITSQHTVSKTVGYFETEMSTDGISDKADEFSGYKLSKITVNGTEVMSLPAKVADKSKICFYYVKDDNTTKTLTASVQHILIDNAEREIIQDEDSFTYREEVSASQESRFKASNIPTKQYYGFKVRDYYINGSKHTVSAWQNTSKILSGAEVKIYYTLDYNVLIQWSAEVQHKRGSEVETETFQTNKNNPYLLESGAVPFKTDKIKPKTYEGWKVGSIFVNGQEKAVLPATLQDGDVVVYDYVSIYDGVVSSVTAKYVDENGKSISNDDVKTGNYGESYETEQKDLRGYNFVSAEGQKTGTFGAENLTVVYHYEKKKTPITIKYLEKGSNAEIAPDVTGFVYYGNPYASVAADIAGYDSAGDSGNTSGTYQDSPIEVIFYYEKKEITITVKHVNEYGISITENEVITCRYGDEISCRVKEIPGYEASSASSVKVTADEDQTVTFTYRPDGTQVKTLSVTVEHWLEDHLEKSQVIAVTKQILEDDAVSTENIQPESFRGWKLSSVKVNDVAEEELPDSVMKDSVISYHYTVDESDRKMLAADISYSLQGDLQDDDKYEIRKEVQYLESNILSTEGVPVRTYTGYKLDGYYINGEKHLSLPETVNSGDSVICYYVADTEQKHTLRASVEYQCNGHIRKAVSLEAETWILQDSFQIADAENISMEDYSAEGYVFSHMLLRQKDGTETEIESLPESLSDGDTIVYVYDMDETKTRTISAVVEYRLGNDITDSEVFEKTVLYASDENMVEVSGDYGRVYNGYKFDGIYVGSEKKDRLPEAVPNGTHIVFQYLLDSEQTKKLSADIEYWHGERKTAYGTLSSTVHVLHDDMIGTGKVDVSVYETDGWKFKSVSVTDADGNTVEYAELPGSVPDGSTVKIQYTKAEVKITVKYIDQDRKEISESTQKTGTAGSSYEVQAKEIPGYRLVSDSVISGSMEEDMDIYFIYEAITYSVIAKYVDENGDDISERAVMSGRYGESYHTDKKDITGYRFVSVSGNENGQYGDADACEIIYRYEREDVRAEIRYIDEDGVQIDADVISGKYGDRYNSTAKEISGYILVSDSGNTSGTLIHGIVITYTYRAVRTSVTVRYVTASGQELSEPVVMTGKYGQKYEIHAKEINGYVLISDNSISGTYGTDNEEIVYIYEKAEHKLMVKYVDTDGNELAAVEEESVNYNDHYETVPKTIKGYRLKEVHGNESGIVTEDSITVVYIYEIDEQQTKEVSASIKYRLGNDVQEEDTIIITNTVQVLQPDIVSLSNVKQKEYTGWVLDTITLNGVVCSSIPASVHDGQVLSFNYVRDDVSVAVRYVDEDENLLFLDAVTGRYGDSYKTHAKEFTGYELVSDSGNTSGEFSYNITVTYTYRLVKTSVVVRYVDSEGNEIEGADVLNGKYGHSYEAEAKEIKGYHLLSENNIETGEFGLQDKVVEFVYEKIHIMITVRFVNEEGEDISTPETVAASYGDSYEIEAKNIVGYIEESVSGPVFGTAGDENIYIEFSYRRDDEQVKTLHADVEYYLADTLQDTVNLTQTKQILEDDSIDSSMVKPREYEGWILDRIVLNGKEILKVPLTVGNGDTLVFYYKVQGEIPDNRYAVTVRYVDADGQEISQRTVLDNSYGNYYRTSPKSIPGYRVSWNSNNTKGVVIHEGMVVTYGYVKEK